MKERLASLWTPTIIIQGVLVISTTGAIIYLAVTLQEIPDVLTTIVKLLLGFLFGATVTRTPPTPQAPPGGN